MVRACIDVPGEGDHLAYSNLLGAGRSDPSAVLVVVVALSFLAPRPRRDVHPTHRRDGRPAQVPGWRASPTSRFSSASRTTTPKHGERRLRHQQPGVRHPLPGRGRADLRGRLALPPRPRDRELRPGHRHDRGLGARSRRLRQPLGRQHADLHVLRRRDASPARRRTRPASGTRATARSSTCTSRATTPTRRRRPSLPWGTARSRAGRRARSGRPSTSRRSLRAHSRLPQRLGRQRSRPRRASRSRPG